MNADGIIVDPHWGVYPVLHIGPVALPAYGTFMLLALLLGGWLYYREAQRAGDAREPALYIFMAALVGGTLGAKLPVLFEQRALLTDSTMAMAALLSGRSIIGGLIGGALAVALLKRKLGIRERRGNLLAPAMAAGVAVGRIGCFLRGCCCGTPTSLPWGVNFGDGVLRHPTQLYEALVAIVLLVFAWHARGWLRQPGLLFRAFIGLYCASRFLMEFIRIAPEHWLVLTLYQWLCVVVVLCYGRALWTAWHLAGLVPQPMAAGGEGNGK